MRASTYLRVAFGATACAWASVAFATEWPDDRDKTLPCRPTIACTADIVPPGTFEVEGGDLFRQLGPNTRQWSFPILAKLTLTKWSQVQVGSNGFTTSRGDVPSRFIDDVTVTMKLHWLDQTPSAPSVSFSGGLSIPTFSGQLGYVQAYDALFTGYITKDFGPLHADWNVGFNEWRLFKSALPQSFTALALSVNVAPPFVLMAEGYYFTDAAPVAARDGGFLFALSHSPTPWLIFDVGGDVGFFPSLRTYSAFIGFSIIPAVLWRPAEPTQVR